MDERCEVPPEGWTCTRVRGHDGPCAAVEAGYATKVRSDLRQAVWEAAQSMHEQDISDFVEEVLDEIVGDRP